MAKRIRFNRFEGKPLPAGAKMVTRPGRFGNPFKGPLAAAQFVQFLAERHTLTGRIVYAAIRYPSDEEIHRELAGFDLACACHPDVPCHADALLDLIAKGESR